MSNARTASTFTELPPALREADMRGWIRYAERLAYRVGRVDDVYAAVSDRARRNVLRDLVQGVAVAFYVLFGAFLLSQGQHGVLGVIAGWGNFGIAALCAGLCLWDARWRRSFLDRLARERP